MNTLLKTADMAQATSTDRNRAVDAYRAIAMFAVAIGHWLVMAIGVDADGTVFARNALEVAPGLSWLTWIFQVMPLFFVVGGFSSAMSLDTHWKRNGEDHVWVTQRLRRMVKPTAVLAGTWLVAIAVGAAVGVSSIVNMGAIGAAIPLWFLANYTIDTLIAPTVLRNLRRNRRRTLTVLIGTFATVEVLHVAGLPWVEWINWVGGWMLFQVLGFTWRDGLLPVGKRMAKWAAGLWALAAALVAFGPWSLSMIDIDGVPFSPTYPPSLALMAFGLAYSCTAIALAPAVTRFLERNRAAWTAVVAANGVSMSVYLWHFTAAIAASGLLYGFDALPTAAIGSGQWWLQKLPLLGLAALFLVPIVAVVSRVERRALLAPRSSVAPRPAVVVAIAVALSCSLKLWSMSNIAGVIAGTIGVLITSRLLKD
jgi:peptidoglycan/LPS O-acetylase OafA/YrhL